MIYPDTIEHKIGFDAVRDMVAALCSCEAARSKCAEASMLNDYDTIIRLLGEVAEMKEIISSPDGFPLGVIHDMTERLTRIRVPGSFLAEDELLHLRSTLASVSAVAAFFATRRTGDDSSPHGFTTPYRRLDTLASDLEPFPELERRIDSVIDRWGNVKDNASPELASIRSRLSSMSGTINSIMRRVIATAVSEGYLDHDTAATVRDGRLVIPVAPMHKRRINGIVHDESASGKTFFIEPAEVVEANNRMRELQIDERREVTRILAEVADMIRPHIDGLLAGFDLLATFDFIQAKARFAVQCGGEMPHVSRDPEIDWYHACHPVLRQSLERHGKEIVPLDIRLDAERRILVISGPNAGGKSVTLKTVGVVQYMLQCGLLPPVYENSRFGVMDSIFIDIGDDQSLEDDLSTYSSHLRNMKFFLARGNSRTLILIDELGSGTEPQIGGAIAQAMLGEFNDKGMWGIVTTHFQNIKQMADDTPGLVNGSMLYDRHLMQPMFKLSIGSPGSSFAIEIARKTGLPESIIAKAEEIVGSDYINLDKYLLDITRDKRYWENKRTAIRQKEKKLEQVLERYEGDAETLRASRREIIADARREAERILSESNAAIERTIHEIRQVQADKERTRQIRQRLADEKRAIAGGADAIADHELTAKAPRPSRRKQAAQAQPQVEAPLAVGDTVLLDGAGVPGSIVELTGKNAVVIFGQLRTTVKTSRLKRTMRQVPTAAKAASFVSASTTDSMRQRQLNFKQEIDVRGMRTDEAVQAVTYFIDDALQFNATTVRILHGTGTGALRQYIRRYLDTVTGVRNYHDEDVRLGGAGITVVNF